MFTGLVTDIGTISQLHRRSDALTIVVTPKAIDAGSLQLGESISHDGVCLTVTEVNKSTYTVLAGAETLSRTTLGALRIGSKVNLEQALRVGDRLGGHWVSGHIDDTAVLSTKRDGGANIVLTFRVKPQWSRYIVAKGSIAISGISLTVNSIVGDEFSVAIIPHTAANTTLGLRSVGDLVNIEVDLIAKHVEKLVAPLSSLPSKGEY